MSEEESTLASSLGVISTHTIPVAPFAGEARTADEVFSLLFAQLEPLVRAEGLVPQYGRILAQGGQAELAAYVDLSLTEGAIVMARCREVVPNEVTLQVGRSSKALRGVVWALLGLGIVAGMLLVQVLLPSLDPVAKLAVGALLGVGIAIGSFFGVRHAPWLTDGRSQETAERLERAVVAWKATWSKPDERAAG